MTTSVPRPATSREVLAWAFFDFANTSYSVIILAAVYPVYFTNVVAPGLAGEQLWGVGYSISMLIVALISPVLGAAADFGGFKKRLLGLFTVVCLACTSLLFFVKSGDVAAGLILLALSNVGFAGGLTFYNAFLPEIARADRMGRISGYGWALGCVGGIASLVLVYPLIKGGFGEENIGLVRIAFPVTAGFFLLAAIPTFIFLRERAAPRPRPQDRGYVRIGWDSVLATIRDIRRFKETAKFLLAYFIYADGIHTVVVYCAVFAANVMQFTPGELVAFFVAVQVAAAGGSAASGFAADRLGPKRIIAFSLIVWTAVVVGISLAASKTWFFSIGITAGVVLGASLSASRALAGLMTPRGKEAQFYGFFSLTEKFAAIIGPVVYGAITVLTGDQRKAFLSLSLFFVVGLLVLRVVQEEKGIAAARESVSPPHAILR